MKLKKKLTLDIECYKNYFLAKFRNQQTGNTVSFAIYEDELLGITHTLDINTIKKILRQYLIVTFNGDNYDMVMLALALQGFTTQELKEASDLIIQGGYKPWHIERHYGMQIPKNINHIDIINVIPGTGSLKIYSGRIHCKKMQDLPIAPEALLTYDEMMGTDTYCGNDLQNTATIFDALEKQITLREQMTATYGVDLRSKSDAQIAEAVIKSEIEKITGERVFKPKIEPGTIFRYTAPSYISFATEQLQTVFSTVCDSNYILSDGGKVMLPKKLSETEITIGDSTYKMGIGGLHSTESSISHYSDDDYVLRDHDVESYYPRLILNQGLYPIHLGPEFLTVYGKIVSTRIAAKRSGDTATADSLKITINGSFGKFGSKYSVLFAPNLLIQTTLTGQLLLLMLIETIELEGIRVVSANTDGIVVKCPRKKEEILNEIISAWEAKTNLITEETRYSSVHSRDVNNYIAIKENGKYKCKGEFAPSGWQKNPQNEICTDAVVQFLTKQVPVETTIRNCKDIKKFVTVRAVTGGGIWVQGVRPETKPTQRLAKQVVAANGWVEYGNGTKDYYKKPFGNISLFDAYKQCFEPTEDTYVGKAIRWYYADRYDTAIHCKLNGNKVPRSDSAKPIMELPDEMPDDINVDWYIDEAYSMLRSVGIDEDSSIPNFSDLI